ncbi:MAG: hypothetical protein DSM106950_04450 [Stigonema ocellatum SAG 48.90 = DSM 106950]|nr:hypothetical protein [Stigonema ocellatum SAG 48.90 = DSM 106950]
MLISKLENQSLVVELLDDEAEAISGGKSTLKIGNFLLSFDNVDFQSDEFDLSIGQGIIYLKNVEVSF